MKLKKVLGTVAFCISAFTAAATVLTGVASKKSADYTALAVDGVALPYDLEQVVHTTVDQQKVAYGPLEEM